MSSSDPDLILLYSRAPLCIKLIMLTQIIVLCQLAHNIINEDARETYSQELQSIHNVMIDQLLANSCFMILELLGCAEYALVRN